MARKLRFAQDVTQDVTQDVAQDVLGATENGL